MYTYSAKIIRIIDGDTYEVLVDLGLKIFTRKTIRLYGVNTPEIRGKQKEKGLRAKQFVEDQLANCNSIVIQTHKDEQGKYGRWLADIIYHPDLDDPHKIKERGKLLSDELIINGFARKISG